MTTITLYDKETRTAISFNPDEVTGLRTNSNQTVWLEKKAGGSIFVPHNLVKDVCDILWKRTSKEDFSNNQPSIKYTLVFPHAWDRAFFINTPNKQTAEKVEEILKKDERFEYVSLAPNTANSIDVILTPYISDLLPNNRKQSVEGIVTSLLGQPQKVV